MDGWKAQPELEKTLIGCVLLAGRASFAGAGCMWISCFSSGTTHTYFVYYLFNYDVNLNTDFY